MGLEWRPSALAVALVMTLGGAARAQRPAGVEPGTLEFSAGGIAGVGLLGSGPNAPELGKDMATLFTTGLQLRVNKLFSPQGDPEGVTLGLSVAGLLMAGGFPAGVSVAEWRPFTVHFRPRFGRLFFELPVGLSVFSTTVDYPTPRYTTALSYSQFRIGMGGGWRWDDIEAGAGINVSLGGGIMNVAFATTVSYVFAPPWEPRKDKPAEALAPGSVEPLSDPPIKVARAAPASGLAGEYASGTETAGRPQKVSLCPDGRYFEGSSRVGSWSASARGDEGDPTLANCAAP